MFSLFPRGNHKCSQRTENTLEEGKYLHFAKERWVYQCLYIVRQTPKVWPPYLHSGGPPLLTTGNLALGISRRNTPHHTVIPEGDMTLFSVNQLLCFAIDILLPKYSPPYTWFWLDAKTRNASWRQQSTQLVSRPPCVPHGRRRDEENVRVSTLGFVTQFDADTSVEPLAKLYIVKRYKAFPVQIIAQCVTSLALCFLAQCIWIIT